MTATCLFQLGVSLAETVSLTGDNRKDGGIGRGGERYWRRSDRSAVLNLYQYTTGMQVKKCAYGFLAQIKTG